MVSAVAAFSADQPLEATTIERRLPGPDDVDIAIAYCGLCHSDVHTVRGEWNHTEYPLVPGHEIVGTVTRVGSDVTRFAPGDVVGVGCFVDSCRECDSCLDGLEQYCDRGATLTYGSVDHRHGGARTQGGYATGIVVDQRYVLRIPRWAGLEDDGRHLAAVAPLLCAGITTYSPMRYFGVDDGDVVGVVGLGGLGHMAVKIAKAMGARVVVFSRTPGKEHDALRLGADDVIISSDAGQMKDASRSIDLILDTVAASHDLMPYLRTLRRDGALMQLGLPPEPMPPIDSSLLARRRLAYAGSMIGGIEETQEMLDFCAENGITADIELIGAGQINEAFDRMVASDVKYRFVLDAATLP